MITSWLVYSNRSNQSTRVFLMPQVDPILAWHASQACARRAMASFCSGWFLQPENTGCEGHELGSQVIGQVGEQFWPTPLCQPTLDRKGWANATEDSISEVPKGAPICFFKGDLQRPERIGCLSPGVFWKRCRSAMWFAPHFLCWEV